MLSKLRFSASLLALALTSGVVACGGNDKPAEAPAPAAAPSAEPAPPPAPAARVEVRDDKIVIHEKVQFEVARSEIRSESFGLLDEVAAVIKKNPQIKRLAVEGHASAEGSEAFNTKLSDDRAKAVAAYLVSKGVAKELLTAQGYGIARPIADNATPEGREQNRRVEFTILEQEVTKRTVAVDGAGKETLIEESKTLVATPKAESAAAAKTPAK
jgi:outer membrane protein OmpA-like peptidoglycan-associated protein